MHFGVLPMGPVDVAKLKSEAKKLEERIDAELVDIAMSKGGDRMLGWFDYSDLPESAQKVGLTFSRSAHTVVIQVPPGPERTVALRKLLEAKEAAVRAAMKPGH
ncbi:MAG: hypothetical protein AAF961_07170 [Planctomycetota bacterium]